MTKPSFEAAIAALWAELGLPAPVPGAAGYDLVVDRQPLRLSTAPDGRSVLVAAHLGELSADRVRAADQIQTILEDGAGFVLSHAAAAALRPARREGGSDAVSIEAVASCDPGELPYLRAAIEDVLFLADIHRPTVAASAAHRSTPVPAFGAEEMIFRL